MFSRLLFKKEIRKKGFHSNDSRPALRSSNLNQKIHEPAPKFKSESKDSWTRSEVQIWIKRFTNWIMIREPSFQIRTRNADRVIWFRSELRSADVSRNRSDEVPIYIKWFMIRTSMSRSESNDLRYAKFRS